MLRGATPSGRERQVNLGAFPRRLRANYLVPLPVHQDGKPLARANTVGHGNNEHLLTVLRGTAPRRIRLGCARVLALGICLRVPTR